MATAASLLALVDTAIENLLAGEHESYSIGGRTVTRLDLDDLFKWREALERQASRESAGGAVRLAKLGRTSR